MCEELSRIDSAGSVSCEFLVLKKLRIRLNICDQPVFNLLFLFRSRNRSFQTARGKGNTGEGEYTYTVLISFLIMKLLARLML